jgi:hypothetical protein
MSLVSNSKAYKIAYEYNAVHFHGTFPFTQVGLRIVQTQFEFKWQSQKADNRFSPPRKPCGVHLVTITREIFSRWGLEMANAG